MEHTKTPGPLKLFVSLFLSASYRQNGVSIFVHSFMNSIEPPGSADISHMASILYLKEFVHTISIHKYFRVIEYNIENTESWIVNGIVYLVQGKWRVKGGY